MIFETGSPVSGDKSLNTKDTKYTKVEKGFDLPGFSFVIFVYFVFKKFLSMLRYGGMNGLL